MDSQLLHLCLLLLQLKAVRLPWIVLLFLASVSNLFLFSIISARMGIGGQILSQMPAREFADNSQLLLDRSTHHDTTKALLDSLIYREGIPPGMVEKLIMICEKSCSELAFQMQYGRRDSSRYISYIKYGDAKVPPKVSCQVSPGAELHCPFITHLVATSLNPKLHQSGNTFGRVEFLSIKAPDNKQIQDPSQTVCAKHGDFKSVIESTIFFQSILFISSGFLYFLMSTVSCISDLKRNGFLKIMFQKGLSVKAFWSAVWINTVAEVLAVALLLVIAHVAHCPSYYQAESIVAVFFATMTQLFSIAALGFLLTVLLHQFFTIGLVLVLIAICSCVIVIVNFVMPTASGTWPKSLLLLLGPTGHIGEFLTAHLMTTAATDSVTGYHNSILAVSILFPTLIVAMTIYLDFVLTTGNGYHLQPGYVLDRRFWTALEPTESVAEDPNEDLQTESPNIEPMLEDLRPIIRLSHVSKRFKNRAQCLGKENDKPIVALDDVSVCIFERQITAIVGHNGSGKTTLLNILSGTDVPTEGLVSVDGLQVSDPINRIRLHKIVGVCPQENSLCNTLTVMQTLELARVSCQDSQISIETLDEILHAMRLRQKKSVYVEKLSCGMRRKLCTAVALIGSAKVLLLDEPTSGVDPLSRRLIWKLLQEYKTKCAVILSTQSMDEADTLADRKIFLSEGALICAGSSLFLKGAFDCGFDFNVMLKSQTHAPLLVNQIQKEFQAVKVRKQFFKNIRFHLPTENIKDLPLLAQALERRSDWIAAFGLHQVSLYDIFLRLKDFKSREIEDLFRIGRIGLLADDEEVESDGTPVKSKRKRLETLLASVEKTLTPSKLQNFRALIYTNFLRISRSRSRLISRIGIPFVLLLVLTVLASIEKLQGNSRLTIRSNITNSGTSFKGGVCLFGGRNQKDNISASKCAAVMTGSPSNSAGTFFTLAVPSSGLLYYLNQPSTIMKIRSICEVAGNNEFGCPLVYSSEWNKNSPNSDRQIYIGSFQTKESFESRKAAFVSIGAYTRLLMYFLTDAFQSGIGEPSQFRIMVESIYDFRGTVIYLYGIFVQIVLLSIIPATFLDDLIEDKETKVKNQLSSIGMDNTNYWITMFFVHWIQYAVIYLISATLVVVVNSSGYANSFYLAGIVLPTLLFGLSNNQLSVYILGSLLNKSSPMIIVAYFFFSIFLVLLVLTAHLDNVTGIVLIALIPPFATIALTFQGTKAIFYTLSFLEVDSITSVRNSAKTIYFSQPHIIASLASIMAHFVIQPLILSIVENRVILLSACKRVGDTVLVEPNVGSFAKDEGVVDEISFVDESPRNENSLLELRHVNVTFRNGAKAVQDVTFSMAFGEIFGLLGPNGAGKSTTMAVIVGQISATGGRCEVRTGERWRSSQIAAKRGHIGFCPQYNPLYADLTAREHLEFYASILGVSKDDADEQIDLLLEGLELDKHDWKASSELSFGCKRRLSLAMSLLGNPCLLVIDEASTGVDPDGRRFLWQAIKSLADEKRSIIVTTHSMEEAEVLASRVGVLNHGCLIGLGAVQQLKNRYGQHYTLELFFATDHSQSAAESVEARKSGAITAVSSKFPNSTIDEEFTDRIALSVPMGSFSRLSHALSWLAEMKQVWQLTSFSFHQMSLEETFIKIISRHNKQLTRCDGVAEAASTLSLNDSQSAEVSIESMDSGND